MARNTNLLSVKDALERIINWDKYNYYTYCYARVGRCLHVQSFDHPVRLVLAGIVSSNYIVVTHATLTDQMGRVITKSDTLVATPSSPHYDGRLVGDYLVYDGKIRLRIIAVFDVKDLDDVIKIYNRLEG